jgi:hypothetical protein
MKALYYKTFGELGGIASSFVLLSATIPLEISLTEACHFGLLVWRFLGGRSYP